MLLGASSTFVQINVASLRVNANVTIVKIVQSHTNQPFSAIVFETVSDTMRSL